jgi:hypothetical protein
MRGEVMAGRDLCKIWCMHARALSLSLSFLSKKIRVKHRAGVMLGDGLLCWVGLDAKPRWEKVLNQNHKRKKRKRRGKLT